MKHTIYLSTDTTHPATPKLMAIGACTESGQMSYFALECDWEKEELSAHAIINVLPGLAGTIKRSAADTSKAIAQWLVGLGHQDIELITAGSYDSEMFQSLPGIHELLSDAGVRICCMPLERVGGLDHDCVRRDAALLMDASESNGGSTARHAQRYAVAIRHGIAKARTPHAIAE